MRNGDEPKKKLVWKVARIGQRSKTRLKFNIESRDRCHPFGGTWSCGRQEQHVFVRRRHREQLVDIRFYGDRIVKVTKGVVRDALLKSDKKMFQFNPNSMQIQPVPKPQTEIGFSFADSNERLAIEVDNPTRAFLIGQKRQKLAF
jgi:hypothetical protein